LVTTTIGFPIVKALWLTYVPANNSIYVSTQLGFTLERIDCNSNLIVASILLGTVPDGTCFASSNNYLYVTSNTGCCVQYVDITTDTVLGAITLPVGYMPFDCTFDINLNNVYVGGLGSVDIQIIDASTNTLKTPISAPSQGNYMTYDNFAERIIYTSVFANSVYVFTTKGISANPLYVTGSSDYNCFIRNLETEPIILVGMYVISENQIQLANPLNIKKRSADGNSKVMPDFPLLQVSSFQEQGNRAFIKFGSKVVFDGRTFFSDYNIDANEEVTFILLYDQFNRGNFSLKEGWLKKPLFYGVTGDREYMDVTHNEVRHKYDDEYDQ